MNLHRAGTARPGIFDDPEVRVSRPGEVVDILGVVSDCLGAVGAADACNLVATRSHHVVLRDCQFHVISPEIGEELCVGVELMAAPGAMPPHSDLREPLRDHEEIAFVTGASEHFRKVVIEDDPERYLGTWCDWLPEVHMKDSVVVGIVEGGGVVWLDEA